MKKFLLTLVVCACSIGAFADTLEFTGLNKSNADTVYLSATGTNGFTNLDVYTGYLNFTDLTPGSQNSIVTVCADIYRDLPNDPTTHLAYLAPVMTGTQSAALNLAGSIVAADFAAASSSVDGQAALQMAVWSALYNNQTSFQQTGGTVSFTGLHSVGSNDSVYDLASTYFSDGVTKGGKAVYFEGTENPYAPQSQSQLTTISYAPQAAPEPFTSVLAGAAGLLGFVMIRRRSA